VRKKRNESVNQLTNRKKAHHMREKFKPMGLEETQQLSDAEYEVAMMFAVKIGLAKRLGPSDEEISELPLHKRILVRLLPTDQRWKYSPFAQAIRDYGLDQRRE